MKKRFLYKMLFIDTFHNYTTINIQKALFKVCALNEFYGI